MLGILMFIAAVLVAFWLIGLIIHILGAFVHVFLVVAIIVIVIAFLTRDR